MGFEYGYSVARPEALVLWEAQFGDFANGAQTIIDEFIASGQAKWTQKSGVVLLLPHGYEGQGPDHSSARIERFLQLAAEDSIAVAQPSTPASHFHLLRAQALGERHRPLIVMTPEVDAAQQGWRSPTRRLHRAARGSRCSATPRSTTRRRSRRVLLCSGKVRWDLVAKREPGRRGRARSRSSRVERLYPLPADEIADQLGRFPNVARCAGCRTSRPNQGAWPFMALNLPNALAEAVPAELEPVPVTRPASSAPSVGSAKVHEAAAACPDSTPRSPGVEPHGCTSPIAASRSSRHAGVTSEVTLAWLADQLRTLRRPEPRVRDPRRAAGHLARPAGRRRRLTTETCRRARLRVRSTRQIWRTPRLFRALVRNVRIGPARRPRSSGAEASARRSPPIARRQSGRERRRASSQRGRTTGRDQPVAAHPSSRDRARRAGAHGRARPPAAA